MGDADDNHSGDPSPVNWSDGEVQEGGEWYCSACGDNPAVPVWVVRYEECCAENGYDADGEPLDIEEQVEEQCTESWVWLVREDDDSWSNVALNALDFDFPEEVTKLYERRSISRLLVTGERALEVIEYMGHSAVCVRTMTQHEIEMYVPTPEEAKEEAQCRLTV